MKILTTFPGRAGDLAWALPTVRAISEHFGVPVDLQIAGEFASMVDLLLQQPYLAGVIPDPRWSLTPPDDWKAPELPQKYDRVIHLGYRGWPETDLPQQIFRSTYGYPELLQIAHPDLHRPWITVEPWACRIAHGWSDCHFELKYGLTHLLHLRNSVDKACVPPGSRWVTEGLELASTWVEAAHLIAGAKVFLGDCSALHVLACALGKPCVVYEPMEARWNPIFYPYGKIGPEVTLVTGNDGLPTCDARHTAETLERVLGRVK